MYRKTAVDLIVDGVTATIRIFTGLLEIACEVDKTIESRNQTKELIKQTEIMKQKTEAMMKESQKRTALIREKKLAEMTPEERSEFEISEMLDKINIRLSS